MWPLPKYWRGCIGLNRLIQPSLRQVAGGVLHRCKSVPLRFAVVLDLRLTCPVRGGQGNDKSL